MDGVGDKVSSRNATKWMRERERKRWMVWKEVSSRNEPYYLGIDREDDVGI